MRDPYCPKCGTRLIEKDLKNEGMIPWCETCGEYRFPMFNTAVSMIVVNESERKILLIKQYGRDAYILVAGYVNRTESLEEAVKREVREETGMEVSSLCFNRSSFFEPSNTLMCNFTAYVKDDHAFSPNEEIDASCWFTFEEARESIKPGSLAQRFLNAFLDASETNDTLAYYDRNAASFAGETQTVGFNEIQDRFLSCLEKGDRILDYGCGSGRDAKYFKDRGYPVTAIDGSKEMCALAAAHTGLDVRCMTFEELDETEAYDGIFACASILHVKKKDLPRVLQKMRDALKKNGVIYVSFKYGEAEGMRDSRWYSDYTEDSFRELIASAGGLAVQSIWISGDVRKGREEQQWLNALLRKETEKGDEI